MDGAYQLQRISLLISAFILLSSVPFLLGLDSLNPETLLERYGLEQRATKGIFYQIAVSSQTYAAATLSIVAGSRLFTQRIRGRLLLLLLVILGTYLVYGSFTRTGWAVYGIGLIFALVYGGSIKGKRILGGLAGALALILIAVFVYKTNQAVQLRVKGGATYRQSVELSAERLLSARMPFIATAVDNLKEEGFGPTLIGYGSQHGMDLFERKTGMAIVSHNRTMELVEASGLVGLFLYLTFLYFLFRASRPVVGCPIALKSQYLTLGLVFLMLYATSHGMPLWGEVVFAPIVSAGLVLRYQRRLSSKEAARIGHGALSARC